MNLRLILFQDCNRSCRFCSNNGFEYNSLPVCRSYAGYEEVCLTGGEPLLRPELVRKVVKEIRSVTDAKIHLYTAKADDHKALLGVLDMVDGLTLTLHTKDDAPIFKEFNNALKLSKITGKSLRLKIFKGIEVPEDDRQGWDVRDNLVWIKDCPLPSNEEFMRYE